MLVEKYGSGLGNHSAADYGVSEDEPAKQIIITQQNIRFKIMSMWVIKFLTTYAKRKMRYFKSSYVLNDQYYGVIMFFVISKMVLPNIHKD